MAMPLNYILFKSPISLKNSLITVKFFLPHWAATKTCSTSTPFSHVQTPKKESISKLKSYLNLMRADKPIGICLLYWPCTWSIALSAPAGCLPNVNLLALFGAGAFLMRSSGCILNDLWDQEYDKKVERTRGRPLASGEVSEKEAVLLLGSLLSVSLAILLQLNPLSVLIGASSLFLVVAYPLAKRFTNWPQIVLGATFNWGALLGYTAATGHFAPGICIPLYVACLCWTVVYDTIYAHQDKHDDILIGVRSTAIHFGDRTRLWLSAFSTAMLINLGVAGLASGQQWPFYTSLAAATAHLGWQVGTLKMESADDCWTKFRSNQWIGTAIMIGIVLSTLLKNSQNDGGDRGEEKGGKDELELFMKRLETRNLNVNFYT